MPGGQDFGRFVNNTDFFEPSAFDERTAMPVLLDLLPSLRDEKVVAAVAGHLRRPWARPTAYGPLLTAFETWALVDTTTGWHLGDALANAAQVRDAPDLVRLVADARYGKARQMLVDAMWRFREVASVESTLRGLCSDPDVCLHAMSAYRRTVGAERALPLLRSLEDAADPLVCRQARQQVKKAEKSIARQSG